MLAPPNAALRKDTARFHRWQRQAPYTTQIRGTSWGDVTGYSDNEALTYVLVQTWRDYERYSGGKPPWKFDVFKAL